MRPIVLFAHGAGIGSSSPWMRRWTERLDTLGEVVLFDYPYMKQGRKRPDPLPKLVEAHREALHWARKRFDGPVVLAGKSMGSRVSCHLARQEEADAIVCFGYPLVSPGKKRQVRAPVLLELDTPILFVQGTRDRLCPLDLLAKVRGKMRAPSELVVVEDGDHSLEITKRRQTAEGITQDDEDDRLLAEIRAFLERTLPKK